MFVYCLSIDLGTVRTKDFGRGMGMLLETFINCSEKYSHLPSQNLQKVTSQLQLKLSTVSILCCVAGVLRETIEFKLQNTEENIKIGLRCT